MSRSKAILLMALGLVLTLTLSACGQAQAPTQESEQAVSKPATSASTPKSSQDTTLAPGRTVITITNSGYDLQNWAVKIGDQVIWKNADATDHTVTFDDGSADSGKIPPGQSASHTFKTAGTFSYHDSMNPTMKAVIAVVK